MKIARIRNVKVPQRAHKEDGGVDFFLPDFDKHFFDDVRDLNDHLESINLNIQDRNWMIFSGEIVYIPSGIKVDVPFGYALMTANKSGRLANDRLAVYPCVIDCGYQGEIIFHLHNISGETIELRSGEKFVQCVLHRIDNSDVIEVPEDDLYANTSTRGEGRMGSTGLQ